MRKRLENHHIAGEKNSEITATVCVPCHLRISERQMAWDSRWNYTNNSENLRNSFILEGVKEILVQMHYETGIKDYRLLADSLASHIQHYREIP